MTLLAHLLALPVQAYRLTASPWVGHACRFQPTCSAYAAEAIRELGATRGLIVAAWRLARCNPFSHGGYDPVAARTIFRPKRGVAA